MSKSHGGRAHSKFSASGSERWHNCPGSVELSEGVEDKSGPAAIEGTQAHEILESIMIAAIRQRAKQVGSLAFGSHVPREMVTHGRNAANFMLGVHNKVEGSEVLVENRVYLTFIHPEMFGTYDGAVLDFFGTLHVFDYKYGITHVVSPIQNLQMIFYALGVAYKFDWNFKTVRLWIIQPRAKNYKGPVFWEISIDELRKYVGVFEKAVERVLKHPEMYVEGSWCYWCKARKKCPLKDEKKQEQARSIFGAAPITKGKDNGKKEGKEKSINEGLKDFEERSQESDEESFY